MNVGKIGVRDNVLLKPDKLTSEERNEMNHHSRYTKEILEEVYFTKEYKSIPSKVYRNTFPGIENPDYRHKR